MSVLAERLRALRAQAGVVAAAPSATRSGELLRAELRHGLGLRARLEQPPTAAVDRALPGTDIAPGLRYVETRQTWPEPLAEVDAGFARLGRIASERLLFFDTETTGLAGGAGTRAFQIGAADWHAGGFRIRQLTLTTLSAEGALLRTFAGWLEPHTVLVSYNGKCYDAPLLATRFRLARLVDPLKPLLHLDLLHPIRRRYRRVWDNCRLATAERQLLGVIREDDLPGSEAPRAWLSYLRGGSAADLRRVATHNAQDLRSLAGLLLRLSALQSAETAAVVAF